LFTRAVRTATDRAIGVVPYGLPRRCDGVLPAHRRALSSARWHGPVCCGSLFACRPLAGCLSLSCWQMLELSLGRRCRSTDPTRGPGAEPRFWCHLQNIHQGFLWPSLRAFAPSSWVSRSICWSFTRSCSLSNSTISAWPWSLPWSLFADGVASSSGMSIIQVNPWGVGVLTPLINPLDTRRLTVWLEMCKAAAASLIVTCMVTRVFGWLIIRVPVGYTVFTQMLTGGVGTAGVCRG